MANCIAGFKKIFGLGQKSEKRFVGFSEYGETPQFPSHNTKRGRNIPNRIRIQMSKWK